MSNLYIFKTSNHSGVYVLARTWKDGRNIVYKEVFANITTLPEITGRRLKKACSNQTGIIDIYKVCKEYFWETCCDSSSFTALDAGDSCRCDVCGKEFKIII